MQIDNYCSFKQHAGVHLNQSWEMPCSGTTDIAVLTTSSNVGPELPGVWIFRIDGKSIIPACPNEGIYVTVFCIPLVWLLCFMITLKAITSVCILIGVHV